MAKIKTYDGAEHDVTDAWHDECVKPHPSLADQTREQHEQRRQALLHSSQGNPLSDEQETELQAITKWQNVNRAWVWMAGRHYNEVRFQYLDQVHGNRMTHSCGCQTQHIFDHHKASAGAEHELHPHFSRKACKTHAHLMLDYKAHRAKVIADNK